MFMSKIPSMYGRHIDLPVIIRTPMGGGFGYGATHSQSLEKHFLGLPNITVVAVCIFTEMENFYASSQLMINKSMLKYSSKTEMMYRLQECSSGPLGPMDILLVSIMITLV